MLSLFASVIGLIPGLENLAASWHSTDLEAKVKMYMAKTGADRDTAVAAIQAAAQVQTRWWFVALLPVLWALPFVAYTWKAVFWDNVICPFGLAVETCNTEPLGGIMATMLLMIVTFYFAHGMRQS